MNCKLFYPKSVIRSCHGLMTDLGLCYKNIKNMGRQGVKSQKNNTSVLLLKKMKKNEKKLFLVNLHIEIIFNFVEILLFNQIINFYL